jgi:flavin reductase (DIM6/NTAB) family NADH-FMN oxidoreductase RutF
VPGSRREIDAAGIAVDPYPLLNSAVAPRAVLWVATRSPGGVANLAPFSWATVASVRPPVVCFTSTAGTNTLDNCRENGEFVLAVAPERLLDRVNLTGVAFPPGVSEFEAAGLTPEAARVVGAPRVAEAPLALECRVVGETTFGTGTAASTVVFGEVVHLAVDEDVLRGGLPDVEWMRPLTRLNRDLWGGLGPVRAVATRTLQDLGDAAVPARESDER